MATWSLSSSDVLAGFRTGELTVETYVQALLDRIVQRDPVIRAWVYLHKDDIVRQAKALDAHPFDARGPLHGLPVGIKDIMLTRDMPTQYNSRIHETDQPIELDAAPVAILRACGALIFGKLSTTEFSVAPQGRWHQNQTANAKDQTRTPGGSSSGSAAAVADFQIPIALGTQTGGSIIRPASYNGCFGWKPTWGVISREGLAQWAITLDTCGFFARSLPDLEIMADTFRIFDDRTVTAAVKTLQGARIAFCRTPYWSLAGPGTRQAMLDAERLCTRAGADCVQLSLPDEFEELLKWHAIIMAAEGGKSFYVQYLKDCDLLHERIKGYVENRAQLTNKDLRDAYDGCARLRPIWDGIASQFDAILAPSAVDEAPVGLDFTGDLSLCVMWTALHAPVINIPGLTGSNGMPVGLTLVDARNTDRRLLKTADVLATVFAEGPN